MSLPLEAKTLHDRLGEMLEQIEAKDPSAQARKFNYQKVILVIREAFLLKHPPRLFVSFYPSLPKGVPLG